MRKSRWRFLVMLVVGILVFLVIHALVPFPHKSPEIKVYSLILCIFITFVVWEGCLRLDDWLNNKIPWVNHTAKRIFVQFGLTLAFTFVGIFVPMYLFDSFVCELPKNLESQIFSLSIVLGLLISFIILILEISAHFFVNWKQSLLEVEKYKSESVQAQLKNLQDHVNPHFLFNNLSVLSSLVYKDQDKAVDFINQLSKVYRYILENKEHEIVMIEKEIAFIEAYIFLLRIRFDNNLIVKQEIHESHKAHFIPPMVLQLLIENCIQHNEVSSGNPLTIQLISDSEYLTISNNLQLRKNDKKSSETGLANIKKRYGYLTDKEVVIHQDNHVFEVKIPLLSVS